MSAPNVGLIGPHAAVFAPLCERAGGRAAILPTAVGNASLAAQHADLLIVACPARELRALLQRIEPGPAARLLLACRGLEPGTGLRPSEVVLQESACLRIGALAGPVVAGEVARGQPVAAVVASPWPEIQRAALAALHSPACRIYPSPHLMEVELAAALARILSAALGLADALGLGAAARALVIVRGGAEGARLARRVGGDPQVFAGLAGIGDVAAAAMLADHPDRLLGQQIAAGSASPELEESCDALLQQEPDMPITAGVRLLARGEATAAEVVAGLLGRQGRAEAG